MRYKNKAVEVLQVQEIFGQKIASIRITDSGSVIEVPYADIDQSITKPTLPGIRFTALACKIKDEISKKSILAPYESSLIPLPHQILVLEKVMKSGHNRFLLADEVGMGKTIETGLILKELKLRGDISRILTIVPKSSMLQWQSELKEHFNEVFHIYDSAIISSMARTFANVNADNEFNFWTQHDQIIVSTDALKPLESRQGWSQSRVDEYNKYRMQAVIDADFDLVIIDEAHKVGGANASVSRYILASELCNSVPNVLLLSATPHRGKSDHFRRILQLLDPDAFAGEGLPSIEELNPYVIRTEKRVAIDYKGNKLFNQRETIRFDVALDINKHQKQIYLYNSVTEYVKLGFNSAKRNRNSAKGLIMILFQRLVSSSTEAILSAMSRRLTRLRNGEMDEDIDYVLEEYKSLEEEMDYFDIENTDVRVSGHGLVDEETMLSNLVAQAKECAESEVDAKAEALLAKYISLKQELSFPDLKILIFTEFRTTQNMLKKYLESKDCTVAIINGTQDIDARRQSLIAFRNETDFLIGTDAASESLNMQFCNVVINYDLPWNPMMIEQRIGRVDRIGQKHKVLAFNMLTSNSVDLRVYQVITEKLDVIIDQLGIDKTSDVLDSAIDVKRVNQLYLQNLLNPERFDNQSDRWLNEIKSKLKNYKSTEGALPEVDENQINTVQASQIKHSPLPMWLKEMIWQYAYIHQMPIKEINKGIYGISMVDNLTKVSLISDVAIQHPDVEHLTLQHHWIKKILKSVEEQSELSPIGILSSLDNETSGYWSLWEVSAHNQLEDKITYQAYFRADNGKLYKAYADDIWSRLLLNDSSFSISEFTNPLNIFEIKDWFNDSLFVAYQNLRTSLQEKLNTIRDNKDKSFQFKSKRINKIGIDNIRISKLAKLEQEMKDWKSEFQLNQSIVPGLKHLLTLRINE